MPSTRYTSTRAARIIQGWFCWVAWKASALPPMRAITELGRPMAATAFSMATVAWSRATPGARSKEMPSEANWPSWLTRSSSRLRS
ncbi:hypothetical protein D3C81_1804620 [compost metagenome]